jgi:hypothetical protein
MTSRHGLETGRVRLAAVLCTAGVLTGCTQAPPAARAVRTPAAAVAPTPRSPTQARYVSVHGDDSGPGTKQRPWRTLSQSLPKLFAGQVLYVHGGVYREVLTQLNLHDGRENRPIAVTNVPGERAVLEGAVWLRRPDHWSINGLNVTWDRRLPDPPRFMVKITGGVGWAWNNSEIWGSRGSANMFVAGFGKSEPSGWSLTGDCFHGLRSATGGADRATNLALGEMAHPGRGSVTRNLIYNDEDQDNLTVGSATAAPRNVDIRYNTIFGGRVAINLRGGAHHVRIARNVMGGTSSNVLVRFDLKHSPHTVVRQNYGVISPEGVAGARRMMQTDTEAAIGGRGNVVSDQEPAFPDPGSCSGFHTKVPTFAPYGRYAL